jgi:enamine deaminase RidA (YjgF/YER057c/UK114 family)
MPESGRVESKRMTVVNPADLTAPKGYSHGMLGEGRVLFVAGQIGWDAHATLVSHSFAEQFDRALANVLTVVAEAGGSPESVGRLTIYVVDKTEYVAAQREVGEKYRARMGRHYPAMTLVEVRSLREDGAKVEIEATALIPR